jgi:hypothetical protein
MHPAWSSEARGAVAVMDEFDLLFHFWVLRAQYDALGAPLTDAERSELLSLVQLAASERDAFVRQDAAQEPRGLPVKLTAGTGFLAGDVRQMAPELLVVAAAEHLAPGTHTILTLADAVSGVEYSLPCVVRWAKRTAPCLMGLSVDGAPSRTAFTTSSSARSLAPFGLGRRPRPMVA